MIGGSSSGSGWSFFRSSSSSSSRETPATFPPQQPAPSTSTSTAHLRDGDTPQSGNEELRSFTARHDDPDVAAVPPDQEHSSYTIPIPLFDLQDALSSSTNEPPLFSTNIQAPLPPSDPSAGSSSESGTSFSSNIPTSPEVAGTASATPSHHLHSLTERKLEKAVLGRAVGLRQLVLLSNAFATRPPPPQPASHSLQYPYASTSQRTAFDEDEVLIFEEDEAERKRREEDWLDSVLDEMLTDAEDDEIEQEKEDQSRQVRLPTRSEREFREPYVHLSIKHDWQSYVSSSSPSHSSPSALAAQHAAMLEEEAEESTQHLETSSFESSTSPPFLLSEEAPWPSDSGFMEPCSIPLPDSADASPNSSAHSQMSDDDEQVVDHFDDYVEEEGTGLAVDQDVCAPCDAASGEQWREQQEALHDEQTNPDAEYPQLGIPISLHTGSTNLASPHSYTSLSLPELAYSATSLNTLSTSPSHSLSIFTPGTSPSDIWTPSTSCTTLSSAEREKQAWKDAQLESNSIECVARSELEPQEVMLPMDDLDIYDDEREEEQSTTSSRDEEEKGSSSGSATSTEDKTHRKRTTTRRTPSLELVRYRSSKQAQLGEGEAKEDDALRIPLYLPLSQSGPTGLFSSRTGSLERDSMPMPPLPPSLLSVMMGKTPGVVVELDSTSSDERSSISRKGYFSDATLPERGDDKLRLPIFLPSEIVKSLYDSVDFGLAPCVSLNNTSPSQSPLLLPFEFPAIPTSPGASSRTGGPLSRSRSKSLTLLDPLVHTSTNASPGGLLFSSLGLFGLSDSDTTSDKNNTGGGIWDQSYASQRRRSLSSTPLDTFAQASEENSNNVSGFPSTRASRSMLHNVTRNIASSRSPSRLRLFLDQDDSLAEDFEFGSI